MCQKRAEGVPKMCQRYAIARATIKLSHCAVHCHHHWNDFTDLPLTLPLEKEFYWFQKLIAWKSANRCAKCVPKACHGACQLVNYRRVSHCAVQTSLMGPNHLHSNENHTAPAVEEGISGTSMEAPVVGIQKLSGQLINQKKREEGKKEGKERKTGEKWREEKERKEKFKLNLLKNCNNHKFFGYTVKITN